MVRGSSRRDAIPMTTQPTGRGYHPFCGGSGPTVNDAAMFVALQARREAEAYRRSMLTAEERAAEDAARLLEEQRNARRRRGFLWLLVCPALAARYGVSFHRPRRVRLLWRALVAVIFGVAALTEAAGGRWIDVPVAVLVCAVATWRLRRAMQESPCAP